MSFLLRHRDRIRFQPVIQSSIEFDPHVAGNSYVAGIHTTFNLLQAEFRDDHGHVLPSCISKFDCDLTFVSHIRLQRVIQLPFDLDSHVSGHSNTGNSTTCNSLEAESRDVSQSMLTLPFPETECDLFFAFTSGLASGDLELAIAFLASLTTSSTRTIGAKCYGYYFRLFYF